MKCRSGSGGHAVWVSRTLPPHLAWPVKASSVKDALGKLAGEVDVAWMSWVKSASDTPLHATWSPLTGQVIGSTRVDGAKLWIAPVDKERVAALRSLVAEQLLPQARAWLADALTADEGWRLMRHERRWLVSASGEVVPQDADGAEPNAHRGGRKYRAPVR